MIHRLSSWCIGKFVFFCLQLLQFGDILLPSQPFSTTLIYHTKLWKSTQLVREIKLSNYKKVGINGRWGTANQLIRCLSLSDHRIVLLVGFHFKCLLNLYVACLQLLLTFDKLVHKILPDKRADSDMDDDEEKKVEPPVLFFFSSICSWFFIFVLSFAKHMFMIWVLLFFSQNYSGLQ